MNFKDRRQRLVNAVSTDLIVVGAASQIQSSRDQAFKFRQDSNFYYLTGISEPDWILVMDSSSGREWLIEPPKSHHKTIFDGDSDEVTAQTTSGIDETLSDKQGWKRLNERLAQTERLGVQLPPGKAIKRYQMLANPSRRHLLEKLKRRFSGQLVDVAQEIAVMRTIKDDVEISLIEDAARHTIDVLNQVQNELGSFGYEYEVEAFITEKFRNRNYEHAYFPIVASGPNATTLHYAQNSAPLNQGDLLLIDVGAAANMYCADITRTFPIGSPDARTLAVLDAAVDIQKRLISIIKPGLSLKQLESEALNLIGAALNQLGLIDKPDEKIIRQYFPHSVSHFLGLDVHDVGDYDSKLEPGMVITVEPGIYDRANGYGMRVEDDILITREGCRVLGYNGA